MRVLPHRTARNRGDIGHAHAHIVPMHEATGITLRRYIAEDQLTFRPRPRASPEELMEEAQRLGAASG